MASAWLALTGSPVSIISFPRPRPTRRGRRWVPPAPGMMPSLTSGWPNIALSEAMRRSQAMAISFPPPKQWPLTAAMMGGASSSICRRRVWNSPEYSSAVSGERSRSSDRSAPALKALPLPVRMMALASVEQASRSSRSRAEESAFICRSRSRVTTRTFPRCSVVTNGMAEPRTLAYIYVTREAASGSPGRLRAAKTFIKGVPRQSRHASEVGGRDRGDHGARDVPAGRQRQRRHLRRQDSRPLRRCERHRGEAPRAVPLRHRRGARHGLREAGGSGQSHPHHGTRGLRREDLHDPPYRDGPRGARYRKAGARGLGVLYLCRGEEGQAH